MNVNGLSGRASQRAAGGLWMTLYGAVASSVLWGATEWWLSLAVWGLVTAALGLMGITQLLKLRQLPKRRTGRRTLDRVLARNIGAIILVYAIVEGITAELLHLLQYDAFIFPVAVAIAGLHFWAFARVVSTWQYYVTGVLDLLAVALTLAFANPRATIGGFGALVFYPLVGSGIALFITAALMLRESVALTRRLQSAPR